MKKSLLLLASLFVGSVATYADELPTVKYTSFADAVANQEVVYLYNVERGLFLTGGNYWNTRACGVNNGSNSKDNYASLDDLAGGKASIMGYKWLIQATGETSEETGSAYYSIENKTTSNYLTADGWDGIWVDGASDRPYNLWYVTDKGSNTFEMYYDGMVGPFGFNGEAYNSTQQTNTFFIDPEKTYDQEVEGETITSPVFGNTNYTTWALVSEEEYQRVLPLLTAYYKRPGLKVALDNAKKDYPNLDFSAPQKVYDDPNSDADAIQGALQEIDNIISKYKATLATFDEPVDYAAMFGDNGVDTGKWTREFTGEGTVGTWHTNTWSTEADGGADGTDMVKPFCEDWVGSGSLLSDQKIYQTLQGAAPGLYKFDANVRLYNEKGDQTALTGCTMYFGDEQVDLSSKVEMYKSGSKCVLWKKGGFSIIAIVKEAGDIEFGFNIQNPTFNWMAFKDLSLKYYGNENVEANAIILAKGTTSYEKYDGEDANAELISAYNEAIDALESANTAEEIEAAKDVIIAAKDALDKNIEAYKKLMDKIDEWDKNVGDNSNLEGDLWNEFGDFMMGEEVEGYPTPTVTALKEGDRSLTTAEIEDYILQVDKKYAAAVAACVIPGTDCTSMLINPDFRDVNGKGWTKSGSVTMRGGLHNFPVAESWHSKFDVYQDVEGVQDGIYSLSLNGFCRLDGEAKVAGQIYMNDFYSDMKDIDDVNELVSVDNAQDGFNCYLSTGSDGAWTNNPIFWVDEYGTPCTWNSPNNATDTTNEHDGVNYYAPNGMEGASVAFSAGRYLAKVYGLVEGGKMRLGVRCTSAGQWVLWSNFKLTYEGKSEEALSSILPVYKQKLEAYVEENSENMTTAAAGDVDKALKAADDAANADEMYNALIGINSTMNAVKENVAAVEAYNAAYSNLEAALSTEGADSKPYEKIQNRVENAMSLSTADLLQLVEEMNAACLPIVIGAASANNPIDITDYVVVNPRFDTANANGWTDTFTEGNHGYQSNSTYGPAEEINQFVEAWKSGAALADGMIYQEVTLPAGSYVLSADVIAKDQVNSESVYGMSLFAGDNSVAVDADSSAPGHYEVPFTVAENGTIKIGIATEGTNGNWLCADNFQITCLGSDPTAIATVNAASAGASEIYTVSGARTNKLQKGINIVKMSNGTVQKVLVK